MYINQRNLALIREQRAFSFCGMKKTLGHTVNYGVEKRARWTGDFVGSSDDIFVTLISNELMKIITEGRQRLFT